MNEFSKWATLEETMWRQKSRELWLRDRDKNTTFFHEMANACRQRNFLVKSRVKGV